MDNPRRRTLIRVGRAAHLHPSAGAHAGRGPVAVRVPRRTSRRRARPGVRLVLPRGPRPRSGL